MFTMERAKNQKMGTRYQGEIRREWDLIHTGLFLFHQRKYLNPAIASVRDKNFSFVIDTHLRGEVKEAFIPAHAQLPPQKRTILAEDDNA